MPVDPTPTPGPPESPPNLIKCRDDRAPIALLHEPSLSTSAPSFRVGDNASCSWAKPGEVIRPEALRSRIEPWLTALWQSEHLSVLVGSGLTQAIHRLATGKPAAGMAPVKFGPFHEVIASAADRSAKAAARGQGNLEDQIRVANELLRGLDVLGSLARGLPSTPVDLQGQLTSVLDELAASVLGSERAIVQAPEESRDRAFGYLVSFLMSFASRTGTRDRLHVFTTNYDRLIEAGAEVAGMHLLDRFVGTIAPVFRSSRLDLDLHYNPPGIRGEPRYVEGVARFTKLHGSLDWIERERAIRRIGLPFGATSLSPFVAAESIHTESPQLMIYPNAAKDRETAGVPYVDLFRDFAAAVCRPNHALVTFGYSFGDEHINRVIEDMLTVPSTHLVAISYDDPLGRIAATYDSLGRPAQVSLLIGDHVGQFKALVDHYLPKPAIDRTTFRMAELLKARWGVSRPDSQDGAGEAPTQEPLK